MYASIKLPVSRENRSLEPGIDLDLVELVQGAEL